MKLSFTTLACPQWDLDQILAAARKYGYDAFDFRHYRGSTDLPSMPEFTTGLADTAKKIAAAGLKVSGISSGIHVFSTEPEQREQAVKAAGAYARIAAGLGAPLLRVFGGAVKETPRAEAVRLAGQTLRAMAAAASREGVTIALETHDAWCRGADVMEMLDAAQAGRAVGVLWDVLNAVTDAREAPEETWRHIQGHLVGTHWKDTATLPPAKTQYVLPGHGLAPFARFYALIAGSGYDGYYTFEWEKAWHPELAEADVALPVFVQCMRGLEKGQIDSHATEKL